MSALATLIRRGRRRHLRHLFAHEASFSAALALGGAILLLLLGTQILDWYWLAILFAGSLAVGIYRARTKVLSSYQVAQSVDSQLGLHDTLSTALFFEDHPSRSYSSAEFVTHQRRVAEDLARSADIQRGVPFLRPRSFYVNAGLALLVCAVFGLRYGVNRSLDLRPSLVKIGFDGFLGSREIADAKKIRRDQRPFDQDGRRENGPVVDPWESKGGDLDPAQDGALKVVDTPEVNNPDGGAKSQAKDKATGTEKQEPSDDSRDSADKGPRSEPSSDALADADSSPDGSQPNKPGSPKDSNQSASSGDNSSLTDKMRDAFANLMAKLKLQPKGGDSKQSGSSPQNSSQQAQRQSSSADSKASQSNSQQQSDSASNAQSQGQQSQNGAQQSAQGKSDGRSSDRSTTQEGKSGIGRQDGDKSAREAEQLAAMGKISEIIGKRSANVSGEVMVEVSSGKQQLKTQYSQRKAAHAEAGGEINRDEVPLAYQQYVQQYFEEIRKIPAQKAKAKTPGN